MTKRLLIDATHEEEVRVVIADEARIHEFDISATTKTQNKGNIYLAKVTRVEPSLQAAFVEYGGDRQGFLPFSEIHPDYYQIPVADRQKLIEEAAAAINDDEPDEESKAEEKPKAKRSRGGRGRGKKAAAENDPQSEEGTNNEDTTSSEETKPAETVETAEEEKKAEKPKRPRRAPRKKVAPKKDDAKTETSADSKGDDKPEGPAYQAAATPESETVKSEVIEEESNPAAADGNDLPLPSSGDDSDAAVESVGDDEGDVETLMDDDEFMRRRKAAFLRRYKIQEVIKRGQIMLIQVVKEERGNKGASLTTYISLAGRYCVLMPNSPRTGGISRKISRSDDRKRLKKISDEIRSKGGMSAIIRTAGIDRTSTEIKRDYDYLIKLWSQIRELTISSTAPTMVYEEADILKRSLRDLYSSDIKEIIVAGEAAQKRAKEFMKIMMPSHAARVKLHQDSTPLFYAYGVEDQLLRMHEPMVKLESGGSIVMNPTEALVAIDVNSGRSTTERNVEETALKTNIEAAKEVARQLRLRDYAGLIVIDFIDMFDYKNRRAVERQLKDALKQDRAKIQVGRISAFGLLEMSRQRLRPSLSETNMTTCPHCDGRGFVMSPEALGIQQVRMLEKEAASGEYQQLKLRLPQEVALYILNTKRDRLAEIEKQHDLEIFIEIADHLIGASAFILERTTRDGQKTEISGADGVPAESKRARQRKRKRERANKKEKKADKKAKQEQPSSANEEAEIVSDDNAEEDKGKRGRRRRGGRGRGKKPEEQTSSVSDDQPAEKPAATQVDEAAPAKEEKPKAKRGRKPKAEESTPAKSEEDAKKPANDSNAPAEDKGPAKKGWWRKIVE